MSRQCVDETVCARHTGEFTTIPTYVLEYVIDKVKKRGHKLVTQATQLNIQLATDCLPLKCVLIFLFISTRLKLYGL